MEAIAYVIGVLVIVVGLGVSIALHEIGHLVPAKLFGVHVGKYMIGFGKTLWSKKIGETEYGVKLLPLGGFISMSGMYPPSEQERERAAAASRGEHVPAQAESRATGFFKTMVQDARDANDETLTGDDSRTFYRLPMWKRIVIMFGGPFMNLVLAIVIFTVVFSGFGLQTATTTVANVAECVQTAGNQTGTCSADDPRGPAAAAGILPGDTIVSVEDTQISEFAQVIAIVSTSPGVPLEFVISRGGEEQTVTLTPLLAERQVRSADGTLATKPDGTPIVEPIGFVGMTAATDFVRQPLQTGVEQAFDNVGRVTGIIVQLPAKLFDTAQTLITGADRDPDGLVSLIGVGRLAGDIAVTDSPIQTRVSAVLGLLGSLNIALFVFNLVPLLPLDGGHIAVALWDGIRRGWAKLFGKPAPKPADATKLVPITFVVVVLLIGMSALLFVADIFNPMKLF